MPRRPSFSINRPNTELMGIQLEIEPIEDGQLPSNYTYFLHAWFLDQMRQMSSVLSKELHDNQEEKAFTLSGFLGNVEMHERTVLFRSGERYCCVITGLTAIVCQTLGEWQVPQEISNSEFKNQEELARRLGGESANIKSIKACHPSKRRYLVRLRMS